MVYEFISFTAKKATGDQILITPGFGLIMISP